MKVPVKTLIVIATAGFFLACEPSNDNQAYDFPSKKVLATDDNQDDDPEPEPNN